MAAFDSFDKVPAWQKTLMLVLGAGAVLAIWYFVFYADAVESRIAAKKSVNTAQVELDRVTKEKEDFIKRQADFSEVESQLGKKMEVLPMSVSTVDNLMQTFQQQARLVGLTVQSWTPEGETKEDYYARLPIKVQAGGTWAQTGEFFRRVSELDRIVSVDKLSLRAQKGEEVEHPGLEVSFEAATYRFLSDEERTANTGKRNRRRKKKKKE